MEILSEDFVRDAQDILRCLSEVSEAYYSLQDALYSLSYYLEDNPSLEMHVDNRIRDLENFGSDLYDDIESIREEVSQSDDDNEIAESMKTKNESKKDSQFKSWVDVALGTHDEREQAFIDEEVGKVMENVLSSYRKVRMLNEEDEINEENLCESTLRSACNKYGFNFDRAKEYILKGNRK